MSVMVAATVPETRIEPLLRTEGLVKRYGGVVATDHVSLSVGRGEVVGVIGPNGAGKSTLIGLLGGALAPSDGSIHFEGADITHMPASERARLGIGRTFQIPRPFLDISVRENLLAARYSLHPFIARRHAEEACDRILERCGLADAAALQARELPLLRRKRLEVARALALDPKLLLLDEVGAGLVDSEVSELIELINSLRAEIQSIVIIEHVLRVVRACCERLMVINFGKNFAEGPTAEVLASDRVAAIYLGTAHGVKTQPEREPVIKTTTTLAKPFPRHGTLPLLELRNIHAGYGQASVLNGVSLTVSSGQAVAILGINGAGKTTLAGVIGGAIRPSSGELFIEGKNCTGVPAYRIARAGIAQCLEGRRIFSTLSVEENLLLAARDVDKHEQTKRLDRVFTLFPDLKERRRNAGTSMSGGQQQMLAIGRALMSRPKLIVFDEISLGLAPVIMDRLYDALHDLRAEGLSMLIVEQDVERALDLVDDVHVLEHGVFALSGSAHDVRNNPLLRHLYIGTAD